jgi:biotin synthase-like enzyme
MISEGMVAQLITQENEVFEEAGKLAHKRKMLLSSPLVMTRACNLDPLCRHCSWRANRPLMKNYAYASINKDEAVLRATRIQQSGADSVYLVSGWLNRLPKYFFECIEAIRANTSIGITATFGAINKADLKTLKEAGIDRISCALETTNAEAFRNLKPGDSYEARLNTLKDAKEMGLKISTNFLIGIGETIDDIDSGIRLSEKLGFDFLSISSLQPTPFTESEKWDRPRPYFVARVAAAARIAMPESDITASFGCDSYADMSWGMKCGANSFVISLRNPNETPELLGDETSRLRIMWNEYMTNQIL